MKKVISFVLVIVMVISVFAGLQITSSAIDPVGQCGQNVYYTYNENTRSLVISGTGDMYDYYEIGNVSPFFGREFSSVTIKSGVTSIGDANFAGCNIKSINIFGDTGTGSDIIVYNEDCVSCVITVPIEAVTVTRIGEKAFKRCKGLTNITIPDSVEHINRDAFYDCDSLTSVTIGDNVTAIERETFFDCDNLKSVKIGKSVSYIGEYAFETCDSLTAINLPDSVVSIGPDAFWGCISLQTVTLSDSLKRIGDRAFEDCISLNSIVIPDSVTSIGSLAFENCKSLKIVRLSESINIINRYLFANCDSLTSITVPDSVTDIVEKAFIGCTALKSVYLPNSVKTIGGSAFEGCDSISNVYYSGTQKEWKSIVIDSGNECLTKATIHFLVNHKHTYKAKVFAPKLTALGYTCYKCSSCGAYKKDAAGNVYKFRFTAPTGKLAPVKCAARTANAEKLTWTKVTGISGYHIQLLNSSNKQVAEKITTANSYTFTNLVAGHAYRARVRFFITKDSKRYFGQWSTLSLLPTLPASTSLTRVTPAKKAFTAQWKAVSCTGYQLQYSVFSNFKYSGTLTIKNAKTLKYTKSALIANKTYYVRVRAYKTINKVNYYSAWSGVKAVTTKK